jgi:hypothetical protein
MEIKLSIPEEYFGGEEKNLANLLGADTEDELPEKLEEILLAALDEYRDMLLHKGAPSRADEILEYRLYYLIKHHFGGFIPAELEVSRLFQLPLTRARNLILYVLTRFRYDLTKEIRRTLEDIIQSAQHLRTSDREEYRVLIGSANMVDELNRIIATTGGLRFQQLSKVRGESNCYAIAVDSYDVLRSYLLPAAKAESEPVAAEAPEQVMEDITQRLKDSFGAISLILVFVFVWFDLRYPQIVAAIRADAPDPVQARARQNFRRMLMSGLLQKCVPLIVVNGVLVYLLLPLLVAVLRSSTLRLWNFDFIRTAFLFIFLFVAGFFAWSVGLGIQLWRRYQSCK